MFTFNRVVTDTKNESVRRREITIEIQNELGHTKQQMMSFSIGESAENIKKAFKAYIDEINIVPGAITDLAVTPTTPPQPTQAEIARTEWDIDRNKLKTLMELVRDGVFTGSEAQITALQAKVKTGFKVGYLG